MKEKSSKIIMLIISAVWFILLSFSILPAVFSVMLADGGSDFSIYLAIYSLMTLPFVLGGSILLSWLFYFFKKYRIAFVFLGLPVINLLLILVLVVIPELRA